MIKWFNGYNGGRGIFVCVSHHVKRKHLQRENICATLHFISDWVKIIYNFKS